MGTVMPLGRNVTCYQLDMSWCSLPWAFLDILLVDAKRAWVFVRILGIGCWFPSCWFLWLAFPVFLCESLSSLIQSRCFTYNSLSAFKTRTVWRNSPIAEEPISTASAIILKTSGFWSHVQLWSGLETNLPSSTAKWLKKKSRWRTPMFHWWFHECFQIGSLFS